MTTIPLYPYRRIDGDVQWSALEVSLNGEAVDPGEAADRWDAQTELSIAVTATAPLTVLKQLSDEHVPVLVLSVGCYSTAETRSASVKLVRGSTSASATGRVSLLGSMISEDLTVRAALTLPVGDEEWLSRRIVAQRRNETISLESDLAGFPTSAISFKERGWADAPWKIDVTAGDLADPFMHSIRLILNVDFPRVVNLIDGRADPGTKAELNASIIRALVHAARKLSDDATWDGKSADHSLRRAVEEAPDSIAAAAEKVSRNYLERSIHSAVSSLRTQPHQVEMLILRGAQILKDKR